MREEEEDPQQKMSESTQRLCTCFNCTLNLVHYFYENHKHTLNSLNQVFSENTLWSLGGQSWMFYEIRYLLTKICFYLITKVYT